MPDKLPAEIQQRLITDTTLRALLATYGSPALPAVFQRRAPADIGTFPYITYDLDVVADSAETKLREVTGLLMHVWAYVPGGSSPGKAQDIALRIVELFDEQRIYESDHGGQRAFYRGQTLVDEPDADGVIHIVLSFEIHGWNQHMATFLTSTN